MNKLEKAIEKSKYILELKDNYDDQGSPAINLEAYNSVISWLRKFWNDTEPNISHCSEDSIDVYIVKKPLFLYANINSNECDYYAGEKKKKTKMAIRFMS